MKRWLEIRLGEGELGMTLIELLIAAALGVLVLGAASSMMVSAVRNQPKVSERTQDISTARWALERMTREIRNGIDVMPGHSASTVSFTASVRRASCGSEAALPASAPSIECMVTYSCSGTACTRSETTPGAAGTGTPKTIFTGINNEKVFSYTPSEGEPGFIGVTLRFPLPDGGGNFTISDGATLRGGDPFGG